jgi:hypothetical protein
VLPYFKDVALMPFGRLRFRSVYTDLEITKVDHATLAEYNLYTELRCELSSPVMPALLNGHWQGGSWTEHSLVPFLPSLPFPSIPSLRVLSVA